MTLDALNEAAERAVASQEAAGHPAVLLVSPGLRPVMSRLLRRGLPRLAVISYAEIPADKIVQVSVQMETGENS
jgi:flagellar biosynthesis protein FlhA